MTKGYLRTGYGGVGMNAAKPATDLRDRIAAVLYEDGQRPMATAARLADAVITELGLRPERGQRSNPDGPLWGSNNRHNVTRYVTEWETDD